MSDLQSTFRKLLTASIVIGFGYTVFDYLKTKRQLRQAKYTPILDVADLPKANKNQTYLIRGKVHSSKQLREFKLDARTNHIYFCYPNASPYIQQAMLFDLYVNQYPWTLKDARTDQTATVRGIGQGFTTNNLLQPKYTLKQDKVFRDLSFFAKMLAVGAAVFEGICTLVSNIFTRKKDWILFEGAKVGQFNIGIKFFENLPLVIRCQINQDGVILPMDIFKSRKQLLDYLSALANAKGKAVIFTALIGGLVIYQIWKKNKERQEVVHAGKTFLNLPQPKQEVTCVICLTNCRNILFQNCLHLAVCNQCYRTLKDQKCPVCKSPIQRVKNIYSSS